MHPFISVSIPPGLSLSLSYKCFWEDTYFEGLWLEFNLYLWLDKNVLACVIVTSFLICNSIICDSRTKDFYVSNMYIMIFRIKLEALMFSEIYLSSIIFLFYKKLYKMYYETILTIYISHIHACLYNIFNIYFHSYQICSLF